MAPTQQQIDRVRARLFAILRAAIHSDTSLPAVRAGIVDDATHALELVDVIERVTQAPAVTVQPIAPDGPRRVCGAPLYDCGHVAARCIILANVPHVHEPSVRVAILKGLAIAAGTWKLRRNDVVGMIDDQAVAV